MIEKFNASSQQFNIVITIKLSNRQFTQNFFITLKDIQIIANELHVKYTHGHGVQTSHILLTI